ncbi:MAG: amidase [Gemmatimonadetes bacterium 13_1_40CM_70_11]|nr:MAG: amidase [Gemmatimonadetes bacterium 13_1_40CM_70_11]
MTPRDIAFSSVRELGRRLRAGAMSSLALTEIYLERIARLGPAYNAFVTVTADRARDEARAADRELKRGNDRGPLHGIPYAAKDLLATAGTPTTWGAVPYRDQRFDEDATVITRLRAAGAVLLGKLAMVELAGGMGYRYASASIAGPGKNPWSTDRWTGGSSSGSGAATAAALAAFTLGTETWGSIVTPAAMCGVAGLRPTLGRVSRHGAMALSWTLDKIGVLARSADDCGLALAAVAGRDAKDPWSAAAPYSYRRAGARAGKFRIGVVKSAWEKPEPEVAATFGAALKMLERIATLEEVSLPDLPTNQAAGIIINGEVAAAFEDLIDSGQAKQLTDPVGKLGGYAAELVLARDYLKAVRVRELARHAFDALLAQYDCLAAPSLPGVAPLLSANLEEVFAGADPVGGGGNLTGIPCISVPMGFGQGGMPLGIQFVGRAWRENTVIAVADAYQRLTDWRTQRPPE